LVIHGFFVVLRQRKQRKTVYVRLNPVDIPVVISASIHCNEIGWMANMGYRVEVRDRQEGVRRAMVAPTITQTDPAKIVFFDREVYGLKQRVFDCERILACVTQDQCAASYRRDAMGSACRGCAIGRHFSGDAPIEEDRHSAINKSLGLSCIRCEKSARTNALLIGRMRLVRSATLCVSCVNRHLEFEKRANSKGAMPRLVLFPATITIQTAEGEKDTLDIGLRLNYHECARYVERVHPGATLIKTAIGGDIISQFSLWTPLPFSPWEPGMVRDEKPSNPKRTYIHRGTPRSSKKTSAAASPVDWDDWDTPLYKLGKPVESDESDADSSRQARRCGWWPPMSAEDDAAYRASFNEPALDPDSIAAFWDGMNANGLPDFIEWLCEGWPEPAAPSAPIEYLSEVTGNPWTGFVVTKRPIGEPSEASAPVADAIALPEVAEPAVSNSEQPEQEVEPSEWEGCYLVRDGVTTYVCDYAKERGISDEEAAIVLGMLDPYYSDEPEPAAAPEPKPEPAPEPVKAEPAWQREKKLTKAEKRHLKKQERSARLHGNPQPAPNRMPAKQTAIAARAYALLQAGK
jgi:hypothetical protein